MKATTPCRKILTLVLVLVLAGSWFFPPPARAITTKEEEELSKEFMKVVQAHLVLIQDSMLLDYIDGVGRKILAQMPPQPFRFHFYLVREDVYNAFAAPAGHIFINSGLLRAMDSEDELAGILSHEICHSVLRHISEKIARANKLGWATLAGIAAGVFLGIGGAVAAGNALATGSIAAAQSLTLAYSRDDEMQADQIGLDYLNRAGYSARGLLKVLKKIRAKEWYGTDQIPDYLRTHPASEDRIAYISTWLDTREPPLSPVDPYAFDRAHARLTAVYGDPQAARDRFAEAVKQSPEDPVAHYGYGLALARSGQRGEAVEQLRLALARRAFDPYFLRDLGQIYFQLGRFEEAAEVLGAAVGLAPGDREALLLYGQIEIEEGRLDSARSTLEKLLEIDADYTPAYYSMGEIFSRQKVMGEAHYYLGIYYRKKGQLKNALFHLSRAVNLLEKGAHRETAEKMLEEMKKAPPAG